MGIKKIVITKGIFLEKELRLLVSYDENDIPLDAIDLDSTYVGEIHLAFVEKVLTDIDSSILKLDNGQKGFIENKKLKPEAFITRHSDKKTVCQADEFYVQITQDRKSTKPCSCRFIGNKPEHEIDFIDYYINNYADSDYEVISDIPEIIEKDLPVKAYIDDAVSLWQVNDITKLLDRMASKIVHLKSGGNIIIDPTEALTVIDVNSGKNSGKSSFMETNIEAVNEIAHQIRLRCISGMIIVDLMKVSKEEEQQLMALFKEACKDDISTVSVHGFSHLGLLEITRSRSFSGII